MNFRSSYEVICSYFPDSMRQAMQKVSVAGRRDVNEIRIRVNQPVSFVFSNQVKFLNTDGFLSDSFSSVTNVITANSDIQHIIRALCRYSVHSYGKEFAQGFFTIENGIRVGVAGTLSTGSERTLKYINALNFRMARQVIGCSEEVCSRIFSSGRKSILICGGVNSGKTTLLRDMCRVCGTKCKVTLIDERSELAASVNGIPENQIGIQTDVLEGYDRAEGIIMSIRSLSPQMIFCDEISSEDDSKAILHGFGCGVKFVSTIHAENYADLQRRSVAKMLLQSGVFDYALILEGESFPGKIKEIRRLRQNV